MFCSSEKEEKFYEFFGNIEKYIEKAKSAESNAVLTTDVSECNNFVNSFGYYFKVEETAKRICKEFKKLYYSLTKDNKCISNGDSNFSTCGEFLNYWVNFKLRENMKDEYNEDDIISYVYNGIESHIGGNGGYNTLLDFLCDIDKDELDKMNILYSLYEKYSKLNAIINTDSQLDKRSLLPFSTECCTHYNQAKYICNDDNNKESTFCDELETFESKYDQLYQKFERKRFEFSDDLITLSECGNNKIITTAITGTFVGLIPLLGVLYKFTPMGQMFRSKMGILNNNISNNDEEMTNMSLMEQENEPLRFKQGKYNIKYQSL